MKTGLFFAYLLFATVIFASCKSTAPSGPETTVRINHPLVGTWEYLHYEMGNKPPQKLPWPIIARFGADGSYLQEIRHAHRKLFQGTWAVRGKQLFLTYVETVFTLEGKVMHRTPHAVQYLIEFPSPDRLVKYESSMIITYGRRR